MVRSPHGAIRASATLLVLAFLFPVRSGAQATTASVEGLVRAATGTPVGGAQIGIRSRETGALRNAVTDAQGRYHLYGVTPGSYDIVAHAIGYRPQRRDSIELVVDEASRVDFALSLNTGPFELDPVVVSADARRDVEHMDVSSAVLEREIERLPLNARDALGLAAITPGVRTFANASGRSPANTGAPTSGRSVNLFVDGAEWKGFNGLVGQPAVGSLLPQEAIREFRVVLNPYDVEFGHGGTWAMSAVTHQGTNDVHGSFFAYGQNANLIARSSNQLAKPDYSRSQLGANLRGPILHDHLFYALSYEGQITDAYVDVVPARPTYDPNVWNGYAGTFAAPYHNNMGMARLTAQYGSHTIDAIWTDRRLTNLSSFGILQSGILQSYDAALVSTYTVATSQLRDRWVAGAFMNELSLSFLSDHQDDEARIPGPVYQYPDLQTLGRTSYPLVQSMRATRLAERPSYAAHGWSGEHALKAGVEVARVRSEAFQPLSRDGFFQFATDTSTLPRMAQIGINYPDPSSTDGARATGYAWTTSAYLQDEWQPARSLRLTAGVRYDADINSLDQGYDNPWMNDTTLQRIFGARYLDARHRRNDLDNVAPRVAASWDVGGSGRTFLRAGYGVMYDRIPLTATFYERVSWSWRTYTFTNPGTSDPAELRRRVLDNQGGTQALPQLQVMPDLLETPETDEWSFGVGRRLTNHLILQMDYLDQQLSRLPVTVRMNAGQRRLTNRFGPIVVWGSFGDGSYRALLSTLTYERGTARLTAAYTLGWSKAEFLGASDAGYPDSASYNMQWASTDERHRLVLSGVADGPFGFQFSTIATVASPHPYAITLGTDANGSGVLYDDWPNGIRSARQHGWAYWYRNVDVRVGKAIGAARGRLIATADVFNVFNTSNHSDYRSMQNQPDYGLPIGDYARRQAQVGMRYQF
jgi:hypothetical protein